MINILRAFEQFGNSRSRLSGWILDWSWPCLHSIENKCPLHYFHYNGQAMPFTLSEIFLCNHIFLVCRFEPDMLAFSGCYYGGGEKERKELAAIRRRWKTLHVSLYYSRLEFLLYKPDFPCFEIQKWKTENQYSGCVHLICN